MNKNNVVCYIIILLIFLLKAFGGVFNENLYVYSPAELHFFDNSLFPNNIDVQLNDGSVSPRLVSFFITSLLMKMGLSYEGAYLLLYILTSVLTAVAVFVFLKKTGIADSLLIAILLATYIAFSALGDFARFQTFTPESLFLGLGLACSTIGVVYVLLNKDKKDLNRPFFFIILASCAHIHEGIWGFVIVALIILYYHRFGIFKSYAMYLSALVILLLTVPVMLTSNQGTGLSSDDFYNIYVLFRAPHHLAFMSSVYQIPATLICYGLIYYIIRITTGDKKDLGLCIFLMVIFVLTMILWYVTSELLHISFFIKLYITKFVKYINLVFIFLLCKSFAHNKINGRYLLLFMIASSVAMKAFIFPIYIIPALMVCVLYVKVPGYDRTKAIILVILAIISVATGLRQYSATVIGIFTLGLIIAFVWENKPVVLLSYLSVVFLFLVGKPMIQHKSFNPSEALLEEASGEQVYSFAKKLADIVPKEEVILADAFSKKSGYIQHIARRDLYALFKAAPSNENGIQEWYSRLQSVKNINDWSAEQQYSFMTQQKMNYLVLESKELDNSFNQLFTEIQREGDLVLLNRIDK